MDERPLAGETYTFELAAHTRGKGVRRLVVGAWVLLGSVASGWIGGPSVGDLVVRRRSDGSEVLRVDAGNEEESPFLVQHVRDQLATLSPEGFRKQWDIVDDA